MGIVLREERVSGSTEMVMDMGAQSRRQGLIFNILLSQLCVFKSKAKTLESQRP